MSRFTESTVEDAALAWLKSAGWQVTRIPDIVPPCLPCLTAGLATGRDMPASGSRHLRAAALADGRMPRREEVWT